ncbi:MAG: ribulose-phosphate 3-epimerase [Candidatus Eremiobacteraeota bacterium]|nr:ribulose-phosphate 3-epimerase [Candidatus Eremiobacteraeota bacterium]
MISDIKVAPSILAADFSRLGEEIIAVEKAGADMIHLDVMDGHFVPNITFGPVVIKSIRKVTNLPFDSHLMIENPEKYIGDVADAGVDILTVQMETCVHLQKVLSQIHECGMKAGVAMNPHTPTEFLEYVMEDLELILVLTVNPGFGGQKLVKSVVPKIRKVREMIDRSGRDIYLEVDGGINSKTCKTVIEAGANLLVAGSAIFGTKNYKSAIEDLRK